MKIIEILRKLHDDSQANVLRALTEEEAETVEVVRRKMAVAESEAARAQILMEEGISPDNLIQLDLDDDVREAIDNILKAGAQ